MINLRKLFSLKDGSRERKIIKMLTRWEASLVPGSLASSPDPVYARSLYRNLQGEKGLAGLRQKGLMPPDLPSEPETLRRLVNTLKHEFLNYLGSPPGEWDLIHPMDCSRDLKAPLPCRLYLDGIRSPYNVGSFFRSAECFGVREILLSPLCADPGHPRARRTAMGCTERIPWRRAGCRELESLKEPCFAMELGGQALSDFSFPTGGILMAGSEELGLSFECLALARASGGIVTVPLYGGKASLNVSVAFGIVMQAWAAACMENQR